MYCALYSCDSPSPQLTVVVKDENDYDESHYLYSEDLVMISKP